MRVNITYSIEMEEIPAQVSEFLSEVGTRFIDLGDSIREIRESLSNNNFSLEKQLERMDKIRRDLAKIDHTMLDCAEILHGYQKALVQLREPQKIEVNHDNETGNEEIEEG